MALKKRDKRQLVHDKVETIGSQKSPMKVRSFYFPERDWQELKKYCENKHISIGGEIRRAIYNYMEKEGIL